MHGRKGRKQKKLREEGNEVGHGTKLEIKDKERNGREGGHKKDMDKQARKE